MRCSMSCRQNLMMVQEEKEEIVNGNKRPQRSADKKSRTKAKVRKTIIQSERSSQNTKQQHPSLQCESNNSLEGLHKIQDSLISLQLADQDRIFYKGSNGEVVTDIQNYSNSEEDIDHTWILDENFRKLKSYPDISSQEKEFMLVFNQFMHKVNPQRNMPLILMKESLMHFVLECKRELSGLRDYVLIHCLNMFDYQKLNPQEVYEVMMEYDKAKRQMEEPERNCQKVH